MDIQWRDYQAECFANIYNYYKNKKVTEQMVVQATGLGKRLQAVWISQKFPTSLFLAHTGELIDQAYKALVKVHGKKKVGIIKGAKKEIDKPVIVATPQTMYNILDQVDKNKFDLVQLDECHHFMAKTFCSVVRHFDHKLRLGWTATPKRLDGLPMSHLFDEISFEYGIDKGIKNKYLCELRGIRVKTEIELKGVKKSMGDFNTKELSERVDIEERNDLIVEKYLQEAKDRQFIVYACNKEHAYHVHNAFSKKGITTDVLVSGDVNDLDRKTMIKRFKKGKLQGIINIDILTEGFDYEDVGCIIMARPTESEAKYVQAIGRGTRSKSLKFIERFGNNCIILDIVDNSGRHSLVNTSSLDKGKDIDDRLFLTTEQKEKFKEEIKEKEERIAKIRSRVTRTENVNLLALPEVDISNSPRMEEKATEAQIKFLKALDLYNEGLDYTKRLAAEAISFAPCDDYKLRQLHKWGYDISNGAMIQQYQKAKKAKERKEKEKEEVIPLSERLKVKYQ